MVPTGGEGDGVTLVFNSGTIAAERVLTRDHPGFAILESLADGWPGELPRHALMAAGGYYEYVQGRVLAHAGFELTLNKINHALRPHGWEVFCNVRRDSNGQWTGERTYRLTRR